MAITFLHSADWQIGRLFGGFPEARAAVLRQARLDCIDRLADAARAANAAHVLVAGDVIDSETAPDTVLLELLAKLASQRPLIWHLLPGNHDPARPGGIWAAVRRLAPAANIRLHLEPVASEIAPGVVLLPAPLGQKSSALDPTGWMDQAATAEGAIRIGLAHGSVQGSFGGEGDANTPIDAGRPARAGLAYLALGDWHGQVRVSERCWYAGTPEPDRFKDNDAGRALVVRIDGATAVPRVTAVETGRFAWSQRRLTLAAAGGLDGLMQEIERAGPRAGQWLLDLKLDGRVGLADEAEIGRRIARLAASVFHLQTDRDRLTLKTGGDDLAVLGAGALRDVATRLAARDDGSDAPAARSARLALRRLAEFAASEPAP